MVFLFYLYNFSVLPLKEAPFPTFYLQNFISFLNIGLASVVVASLGGRFIFPAVSSEGFSYWIIRSSPISLKRFLWTKFWVNIGPVLIVAEILILASNYLLDASAFMMLISAVTIFFMVFGIVGLALGFGAVYPRFETENLVQVATGFGGITFMITSAIYVGLIIILEAWPVYTIFVSRLKDTPLTGLNLFLISSCFICAIIINLTAVFLPMRIGLNNLIARESD